MNNKFQNVRLRLMLFLLVTTFMLFFASGWLIYHWSKNTGEQNLAEKLIAIGQTAANNFSGSDIMLFDEKLLRDLDLSPPLERIFSKLEAIKNQNNLRSVLMLNNEGNILFDISGELKPGEDFTKLSIDKNAWEKALSGRASASDSYSIKNNPFKSAYIPIKDENGSVAAVLRLEASREYFNSLYDLYQIILWIGIIISLLLVMIALYINRMVQNLLAAEDAIAASERFQALGSMTAGIAHELRNPLCIIKNTTEVLIEETGAGEQKNFLKDILEEVERMNHLLTQFLQLSKDSSLDYELKPVEIKELLKNLVKIFQKGIKDNSIKFVTDIPDEIENNGLKISGDERCLRQIFINIIVNALDSMKDKKGEIKIKLIEQKSEAEICVEDQGSGISEADLKRIFDPFFTTKTSGVGLGLSVTKNLTELMGGRIEAESSVGKGTQIKIRLKKINENEAD